MDVEPAESLSVLVVEDEAKLASLLERALTQQGHRVRCVSRGDAAVQAASTRTFDVIVLDVMLPGLSGIEACRRMRAAGVESSIVMLTARGSIDDRIDGLDAGADDYLVKPFALKELYARIRAVRRRGAAERSAPGSLQVGPLRLRPELRACERDGELIELRPKEYAILEHLMRNAGIVVTRVDLLDAAWDGEVDHRSNAIDAQMLRLRQKVDRPFDTHVIETMRGIGYCLRAGD